ncbi:DUF1120 domain-containing protein [Pseudomonas sp. EMN2]|uniref:DUF1120 domain-containing protein n=1 Tax=Pseudomonas sp. EMN2 TaxID=2615212 RepID=UPI0015B3EE4D|nr:DUF1120 domain-containing protein [Pseudomonas sp. EMN2]
MMKLYVPFLALCVTLAGSANVLAASSTDVSVTGTITPAACTPALSGSGNFDFGKISVQDLQPIGNNYFESKPQRFTVTCDAATRFAVRGIDGRSGSAAAPINYFFGLGMSGNEKIGGYRLALMRDGLVADGDTAVTRLRTADGGLNWASETGTYSALYNGSDASFHGFSLQAASEPSPITTLAGDLKVIMSVRGTIPYLEDTAIDGASTIEVSYL